MHDLRPIHELELGPGDLVVLEQWVAPALHTPVARVDMTKRIVEPAIFLGFSFDGAMGRAYFIIENVERPTRASLGDRAAIIQRLKECDG